MRTSAEKTIPRRTSSGGPPRTTEAARAIVDDETFRQGMRRLAAGVSIITTSAEDGDRWGATATAVCSVSADPPTLLCCLNRNSSTGGAIRQSRRLAVNVLSTSDRDLADRFASTLPREEKFRAGAWATAHTGAPVLKTALVSFDCRLARAIDIGTHAIFFGEIIRVSRPAEDADPLLYAGGAYGGFLTAVAI